MKKITLTILLVVTFTVHNIYALSRSELFSEFVAARNTTPKSTFTLEYYSKEQFTRLGDVANRLYLATNQDETVSSLRRENKELQAQLEALNDKLQVIEKPKEVIPQQELKSSKTMIEPTSDDAIVKEKSLTNWLFDNGLLLVLILGGGAYWVSQKQKKNN